MSKRLDQLHQKLEEIIEPVCKAHGVELVRVRYTTRKDGSVVGIMIDRDRFGDELEGSGISLADCTGVSRDVSTALDVHEEEGGAPLIKGAYHLEVSSPGIERPLVRDKDYTRFAGREVEVRTQAPVCDPPRRKFEGTLDGLFDGDGFFSFFNLITSIRL